MKTEFKSLSNLLEEKNMAENKGCATPTEAVTFVLVSLVIMAVCYFAGYFTYHFYGDSIRVSDPIEINATVDGIDLTVPSSTDTLHVWTLIGESEKCKVYYRKHIQNRIYWSLCEDGSSSITVK